MEHDVIIWSEKGGRIGEAPKMMLETHIIITEDDIEELAISKFKDMTMIDNERRYSADIDKTTI